ncbi:MAG: Hpt domain-containing protein [Treponemataceae bacterium]|nr:Hpt domain-containing protein [Treponemataceae bacterium]
MNDVFRKLEEWGCDVAGTKARFLNDQTLFMSCLYGVLEDNSFDRLGKALEEQNLKNAFEAAHNIKGFLANMGLTPMYNIAIEIMEPLRKGIVTGHDDKYKELMDARKKFEQIMTKNGL